MLLTNHGFGLGGIVRLRLAEHTSAVIDLSITAGKDAREQEFFVGPFGETITLFKRNRFLMMPLHVGLEQRLWPVAIEDDFRPFVHIGGGPVLGYQWPYFDDLNDNGRRDPGEPTRGAFDLRGGSFRTGVASTASFGAYFGSGRGNTVGLRLGYAVQYFFQDVQLLEERPEIERSSRRFFGSPVITLHLIGH